MELSNYYEMEGCVIERVPAPPARRVRPSKTCDERPTAAIQEQRDHAVASALAGLSAGLMLMTVLMALPSSIG